MGQGHKTKILTEFALLSLSGLIASDWAKEVGTAYDAPFWVKWINGDEASFSMTHLFGTDILLIGLKKSYYNMAKKYHPDLHLIDDGKAIAEEKIRKFC